MGKTLFEKIWDEHVIVEREDGDVLLYIDRHLTHDLHFRTFGALKAAGLSIKEPDKLFGVPDHSVPTTAKVVDDIPPGEMREAVEVLAAAADEMGFVHYDMTDDRHGIVHVVGPEQGITLPGLILVCGDSHTSTHGALGCISFGIGSTEVGHVMATQTLWQRKPKQMRINITGELGFGVSGKDVILAIIREISAAGGTGYAIEFAGSAIEKMSMEGRMTVSNMTIEAGARAGLIAPDDITFDYLRDKPRAPKGEAWDQAVEYWRSLASDPGATYDTEVTLDVSEIVPLTTWGTSPEDVIPVTGNVPDPADADSPEKRAAMQRALDYMGLTAGMPMADVEVQRVFIGSCTNGRIEDMRAVAEVAKGRQVADGVRAMVVPGSGLVKEQAEAEGIADILKEAGFEWREPGCSMCLAMNPDKLVGDELCASSSNRNFIGRQGSPTGRTVLMSPVMVAASAISGHVADAREVFGLRG